MTLRAAIPWAACAALVACAAPAPPPAASTLDPERLNDGIECMRYAFATDAPRVEAIAASFSTRLFPLPADRERLAREGVQAAIVRTADLGEIRRRLGPLTESTRMPIGQSASWTELARRPLRPDERVGVDSVTVAGAGGEARASVRSWLVPEVAGACAHVEVALHVVEPTSRRALQPGEPPDGTVSKGSVIECCLADGESLLLLPRPLPPPGKGPATGADMPPRVGTLVLGEPVRQAIERPGSGYATAIAISARVPATLQPAPQVPVDSAAPMEDTVEAPSGATP